MRARLHQFALCAAAVIAAGCGGMRNSPGEASAHAKPEPSPAAPSPDLASGGDTLTLNDRMLANVKTEEVAERTLPLTLTATGKVHFNEDRMARIVAPVSGQVQQLEVKIGDTVHKGQTLFQINSREIAAAITEHLENQKDVDLAQKHYIMAKDLYEHEAGSKISVQQAESDLAKAKARAARSEEALRILGARIDGGERLDSRIAIPAPLGGTLIERKVTEGQFVQPENSGLLTIADLSTLWVLADIFERDLHSVRLGQRAEVTTEAYPARAFTARIAHIGDVVDPETRTLKVRFLVNAESMLKPEMFASVRLVLNESERAVCVSSRAVFMENGHHYVFVKSGASTFGRREIDIAHADGGIEKVLNGLKPAESVVTSGALLLRQMESRK